MSRHVALAHGAGGPAMRDLVRAVFLAGVTDAEALAMDDGAAIPLEAARILWQR